MTDFITELNEQYAQSNTDYRRAQLQTYMTGPEWRNVEMAVEYGDFNKDKKPFYLFPYFSQIIDFWKITKNSVQAAHQNGASWWSIFSSEFFVMDVFIGTFVSTEYFIKGSLSLIPRAFSWLTGHKKNDTDLQTKVGELFNNYGEFIHHTPFYDYKYVQWLPSLWAAFYNAESRSLDDIFTLLFLTIELPFRSLISTPIAWIYNSESNQAYETIDVLVETKLDAQTLDSSKLSNEIKIAFADARSKFPNPEFPSAKINPLESANKDDASILFCHDQSSPNNSYTYALLKLPRYVPLQTYIQSLHEHGVDVKRIAGQEKVQIKCKVNYTGEQELENWRQQVNQIKGCQLIYDYENHIDNSRFFAVNVDSSDLSKVLERTSAMDGIETKLIHDF